MRRMEQRISLITLGVADLRRAMDFYAGLGWEGRSPDGDVAFFQTGGMVFALWGRGKLAEDSTVEDGRGRGDRPARRGDVVGRVLGRVRRSRRPPVGDRAQPRLDAARRRHDLALGRDGGVNGTCGLARGGLRIVRPMSSRRERLEAILDARGLDAIVLRDGANLAWYLAGARVHVVAGTPILEVTVGRGGDELRTSAIEAPRLAAEELDADAPGVRVLPWWEPLDAPTGGPAGSDLPRPGEADVADDLMTARAALGPEELERYRALCRDSAAAAAAALRRARPGDSEFALAGRAARELYERGIEPIVMLVAGAERLPLHRHPLPTGAMLGDLAMVVVNGRRHGLVSAVTRMRDRKSTRLNSSH